MHIAIPLPAIQGFFYVSNVETGLITRKAETKMVEMLGKFAKVHNQNFCVNVIVQNLRCNLGKKKSVPKLLTWSELQQCCSEVGNICPPSCQISDGNHFIWYYLQSSLLFPCDFACCFGSPQHISQSGVTVIYTAE